MRIEWPDGYRALILGLQPNASYHWSDRAHRPSLMTCFTETSESDPSVCGYDCASIVKTSTSVISSSLEVRIHPYPISKHIYIVIDKELSMNQKWQ